MVVLKLGVLFLAIFLIGVGAVKKVNDFSINENEGQPPKYYLTFEPHSTSDCNGEISGVGYSGLIDTCFTIDYYTSFRFEIDNEKQGNDEISIKTYGDQVCDYGDSIIDPIQSIKTNVGSCIPAIQFNTNFEYLNNSNGGPGMYHLISIKKVIMPKELIPNNSIVRSFSSSSGGSKSKCTSKSSILSSILIEYYTNNTLVLDGASIDNTTYYCSKNEQPFYSSCSSIGCTNATSYESTCESIIPFYNGTSDYPITTGGDFTTATSGHFSGNTIGSKHVSSSGAMNDNIESITYTSSQFSTDTIGNRPIIDENVESITYTSSQFSTDTIGNRPAIDENIESITYTSSQFSTDTIGNRPAIDENIESITYTSSQFSTDTIGNRPAIDENVESITYTSSQFSTDTIGSKPSYNTYSIGNNNDKGGKGSFISDEHLTYYLTTYCYSS